MLKCWEHKPEKRPTFTELGSMLLAIYAGLPKAKNTEAKFSEHSVVDFYN
jgi:hypothetical protein